MSSTTPIEPRAPTELETSVVTTLLSSSGKAGADDYLAQVPSTQVIAIPMSARSRCPTRRRSRSGKSPAHGAAALF